MPRTFVEAVLQNAAGEDGNGTELVMDGFLCPIFQVTGTFSADVYLEATLDGTNWAELRCVMIAIADGEEAFTNTSGAAIIKPLYSAPYHAVRARIASYASGSVTVIARAIA